jgi:uncharacterized membrane protein YbhN (UPF0104 family)
VDRESPHRRLAAGFGAFVALALLGAAAGGWLDGGSWRWPGVVTNLRAAPLAVAGALLAADVALGGLRLHLWMRRLEPRLGYRACVAAYLVNLFASAVSPLGAASGPAQWGALVRCGARPGRTAAALLLNYVGILAALILLAGLALGHELVTAASGASLGRLPPALFGAAGAAAAAAAALWLSLVLPHLGAAAARAIQVLGDGLRGRVGTLMARVGGAVAHSAADYQAARQVVGRGWIVLLAASCALSTTMFLNRFVVGFLAARSLGIAASYVTVASRQAIQFLMLYFSPSPGGSGLAEATVPAFMAGIVPEGRALEYAIVWRALTSYLGLAAGAVATAVVFSSRRRGRIDTSARDSPSSPGHSPAARTRACGSSPGR